MRREIFIDMDENTRQLILNRDQTNLDTIIRGQGDSNLLVADSSTDRIGIGIGSPDAKLQVDGDLRIANNEWLSSVDSSGTGRINMFKVNQNNEILVGANLNIESLIFARDAGLVTAMDMPVSSVSSEGLPQGYVFRMDGNNILSVYSEADGLGGVQNKRVGIGTIDPGRKLEISTSSGDNLRLRNDDGYADMLMASDGSLTIETSGTDPNLRLQTQNYDNAIYIDDSQQRVGIGTTSPTQTLHVEGDANVTGSLWVGGSQIYASSDIGAGGDLTIAGNTTLGDSPDSDWVKVNGRVEITTDQDEAALSVNQQGSGRLAEFQKNEEDVLTIENNKTIDVHENQIHNVNLQGYNAAGCITKEGNNPPAVACEADDYMISLKNSGGGNWSSVCCRVI